MITINTNVESQTASKQQEMPEVFFFSFYTASKLDSSAQTTV